MLNDKCAVVTVGSERSSFFGERIEMETRGMSIHSDLHRQRARSSWLEIQYLVLHRLVLAQFCVYTGITCNLAMLDWLLMFYSTSSLSIKHESVWIFIHVFQFGHQRRDHLEWVTLFLFVCFVFFFFLFFNRFSSIIDPFLLCATRSFCLFASPSVSAACRQHRADWNRTRSRVFLLTWTQQSSDVTIPPRWLR